MKSPRPSQALPLVHPRPARGWVNDPHAGLWLDGRYHLFAQWNPDSVEHANVHWAHLVSTDLLRWEEQAAALVPGAADDAPDRDGCWSGVAVSTGEETVLVYTGFRTDTPLQTVCLATSSDGARTFVKQPANPVLRAPESLDLVAFRDPFLWQEDGRWQALVGAGFRDGRGAALHFSTQSLHDLQAWTYEGVFCSSDRLGHVGAELELGSVWECPQLLLDGERATLVVSVWEDGPRHVVVISGTRDTGGFRPDDVRPFDHGPDLYAPALGPDRDGRARVLWGWSWEARRRDLGADQWAGVLTLPRDVQLTADGYLAVAPSSEVLRLRGEQRHLTGLAAGDGCDVDPAFELSCRLRPASAVRVADGAGGGFEIGRGIDGAIYLDRAVCERDVSTPGGDEGRSAAGAAAGLPSATWSVDAAAGEAYDDDGVLAVDRGSRFRIPDRERDAGAGAPPPHAVGPGGEDRPDAEEDRVRVLVDASIVEVFWRGESLTARAYPGEGGWRQLRVLSGDDVDVCVWPLRLPAQGTEREAQLSSQEDAGPPDATIAAREAC